MLDFLLHIKKALNEIHPRSVQILLFGEKLVQPVFCTSFVAS